MNEWRQFLNEDSAFFGKSFEEFKRNADKGMPLIQAAISAGLTPLGEGSSRVTYKLPDNPQWVLKIINTMQPASADFRGQDPNKEGVRDVNNFTIQNKRNSNEHEANLKTQLDNPELFPRSTVHADDYSWIVVENVDPLSHAQFMKLLGLPASSNVKDDRKLVKELVEKIMLSKQNLDKKKHYSHRYVAETIETFNVDAIEDDNESAQFMTHKDALDTIDIEPNSAILSAIKKNGTNNSNDDIRDKFDSIEDVETKRKQILSMLKNAQIYRIIMFMSKYKIQSSELKASNLGISKMNGNKLVFLDMSRWDNLDIKDKDGK